MEWGTGSVAWSISVFFFWLIYLWLFITIFTDIFRRDDVRGWAKAVWIVVLIFLPLIGALIYLVARPKVTQMDRRTAEEAEARRRPATPYSAADEIAKAQALRDSGAITEEEFQILKLKAMR